MFPCVYEVIGSGGPGGGALQRGNVCTSHPAAPGSNPVSTWTHFSSAKGISQMLLAAKAWNQSY